MGCSHSKATSTSVKEPHQQRELPVIAEEVTEETETTMIETLPPPREEKMLGSRTLSPSAAPFHPMYEPVHLYIYNEGVPTLSITSEEDRCRIIHNIPDEAIDEEFPPDAQDAAELDEVDDFVKTMADLDLMEEREEAARTTFCHVKKRWEARRAQGLVGRPRPPKHSVEAVDHQAKGSNCTDIVSYQHAHRMLKMQDKMRTKEVARRDEPRSMKKMSAMPQHRIPIQQPRKQY